MKRETNKVKHSKKKEIQLLKEELFLLTRKVDCLFNKGCDANESKRVLAESKYFRADLIAKEDLFDKVKGNLPPVYITEHPTIILPEEEWLNRITRNEIVSPDLPKEVLVAFDKLDTYSIVSYFREQLSAHYYTEADRVRKKHNDILVKYYKDLELSK